MSRTNHGLSTTRAYRLWRAMKTRCNNPKGIQWKDYGGRGLAVCPSWNSPNGFLAFLADMGEPEPHMTLGRIDNDQGYSKSNCRWETRKQQQRNKSTNRRITFNGLTLTLTEWAERLSLRVGTLHARLQQGWSLERALSQPVGPNWKRKRAKE